MVAQDDNGTPVMLRARPDGTLMIAASGSTFVVDELAAAPSDNIYTSVAAAAAAAVLAGPGTRLLIRGDATASGAIDLTGVKVVGLGTVTPTLTVANGCTFRDDLGDYSFENVAISFGGATAVISVTTAATITLERYASISCGLTATAGFIEATGTGSIGVDMNYSNALAGSSGHQVIKLGAGCSAAIRVGNFGTIALNTITGGSDGGVEVTDLSKTGGGAEAVVSHSQAGLINPTYD